VTVSRARRAPGPLAWLPWVVANTASGALGGAAIDALGLIGVVLFGIIGGVAQWLVLRRYLHVTLRWAAATAVGNVLAWAVIPIYVNLGTFVFLLVLLAGSALQNAGIRVNVSFPSSFWLIAYYAIPPALGGAVSGAIVGQSQALVLRRQIEPATQWVRASAAGGAVAGGVAGQDLFVRAISRTFPTLPGLAASAEGWPIYASGIASGAVFGLAYGVITGIALVRLLHQRAPEE
jgi:hypothetical protein